MSHFSTPIKTRDGSMNCHVLHPDGASKWPAVIFYMDGLAIRPDLLPMADRLAKAAYAVVLPDLKD